MKISLVLSFGALFYSVYSKVIAIGDLHSDYERTIKTFILADVINTNLEWIAGNITVVQTGDILDRGDGTFKLLEFLMGLHDKASAAGGQYIQLLGNHEIMNLQGNTTFVNKADFDSFGDEQQRDIAFSQTGWVGSYLRKLDIVAKIGRTVYVHGGINPKWAKLGVDGLNNLNKQYLQNDSKEVLKTRDLYSDEKSKQTPLWYRGFSTKTHDTDCAKLKLSLRILGAERMVVSHTPTESYEIEERCKGRVLIIDTNISRGWKKGGPSALVLTHDSTVALRAGKSARKLTTAAKLI